MIDWLKRPSNAHGFSTPYLPAAEDKRITPSKDEFSLADIPVLGGMIFASLVELLRIASGLIDTFEPSFWANAVLSSVSNRSILL